MPEAMRESKWVQIHNAISRLRNEIDLLNEFIDSLDGTSQWEFKPMGLQPITYDGTRKEG
jgi:hypothetical protein